MDAETIKREVKERYAGFARQGSNCCPGSSCSCVPDDDRMVDYSPLVADVVPGSDLGLGCGLPTRFAEIRPGETVLDLGSGAGVDVFLAAKAVGPRGRVIGLDMTPAMIERARANAARAGVANVDFRLGEIEAMPVAAGSVDLILSNCVINLVPDKAKAFAEMWRVLKPGGRFCISDVVSRGDVPSAVRADVEMWASCLAGAVDREAYLALLQQAGFQDVRVGHEEEYSQLKSDGFAFVSVTVLGTKPA
jgi:arsenite methyltransferase